MIQGLMVVGAVGGATIRPVPVAPPFVEVHVESRCRIGAPFVWFTMPRSTRTCTVPGRTEPAATTRVRRAPTVTVSPQSRRAVRRRRGTKQ